MSHKLYLTQNGLEYCHDSIGADEIVETFKPTPIGRGLYLGKTLDEYNQGVHSQKVYSVETGYGGGKQLTWVGYLNHDDKKYSHTHGYYKPHPTGKKLGRYAEDNGFEIR